MMEEYTLTAVPNALNERNYKPRPRPNAWKDKKTKTGEILNALYRQVVYFLHLLSF